MITLFPKNIFIFLFGLVFLLGGAGTLSAAPVPVDKVQWAFEYKLTTNYLIKMGAWFSGGGSAPEIAGQIQSYPSQASCSASEASWASDSNYEITKSCYETTEGALIGARSIALKNIQNADFIGDPLLKNLSCGVPFIGLNNKVQDCVPILIYYVIYKPASWFLIGAGYVFDAMLTLSIDSNFVNQSFIESSWTVVRDFSNMLFIFILLYTGIQTVFGIGNWRSTVIKVIIMALLINFSLFFTKVVIDAGNILAVGIQSSMGTEKSATAQSFQKTGAVAERNISENLVGAFQPQRFLDTAGKVDALDATIVFLIAAIVSGYAGYVFFKSALIFIGRLIAFWFLMIVSPFAFISIALPAKANKFQEWLDTLLAQAFVAPVFLFLIYIIMQVVNGGNGILNGLMKSSGTTVGAFTFDKVLAPVVVATLLIMALQQALKYSESMAGDFGKLGSQIGGAAMGIATGGTALAGRAVIGGAAAFALKRGYGGERTKALTQASFDVRNLGGKDSMFGATIGGGIAKGVGAFGVGKGGGVGGVEKAEKDHVENALKKAAGRDMNIFEEQGVRNRAQLKKTANEQSLLTANSTATKAKFELEAQSRALAEAEKKATESATGKDQEEASRAYESARQRFEKDKDTADEEGSRKLMNEAADAHSAAKNSHAGSPSGMKLASTTAALERAKQAEKEADEAYKEAMKEGKKDLEEIARGEINKENTARRKTYADKIEELENGGFVWKGIGLFKRESRSTADKIRKGVKAESTESKLKKLVKEMEKEEKIKEVKEEQKEGIESEEKH